MKRSLRSSLLFLFLGTGIALGQEFYTVRSDTTFPVELQHTIRASRAKAGDLVEFRTLEPVLIGNGIVIPENATLVGIVAFSRDASKAEPRSLLRIRVQGLRWKNGQARINAVVGSVYYARSSYVVKMNNGPKPTFLEGIHIVPHLMWQASTDFYADDKEVVLHAGILLQMRHVVVDQIPVSLSASSNAAAENK
ncbi:MAG: hypothetical protein ACM3JB_22810 [Acidobacteriaceae bacterium]